MPSDEGDCLVDRYELGDGMQNLNLVTGDSGQGPFLILAEAPGRLPEDFAVTPQNHLDNRWRKNKSCTRSMKTGSLCPDTRSE